MKITISEDVCSRHKVSLEKILLILLARVSRNIPSALDALLKEDVIRKDEDGYSVSEGWSDSIDNILVESETNKETDDRILELADKMMEEFPKGRKEGSNQYWRGNKKEIAVRLRKFAKMYGGKWTDIELLKATRRYVQSFNGNYKYMRVLKYFIWKVERKQDEEGNQISCETSDLATLLENKEDTVDNNDWTNELR
jgi:hypothetical protein